MKALISIIALIIVIKVQAQDVNLLESRYGSDSAQCVANLSTMVEYAKIKVYDYALPAWREVFKACPRASKNIYIYGVNIYKNKIGKETDSRIKSNYIDTLMLIYDNRIKYFGEEGYVKIRKGLDLLYYRPDNIKEIYELLKNGISLSGTKAELNALIACMKISPALLNNNLISNDELTNNYMLFTEILDKLSIANPSDSLILQTKNIIDQVYISILPDCNKIEELYAPEVAKSEIAGDKLKQIVKLLEMARCIENSIYFNALTKLFDIEPNANIAYILGKMNAKTQNYQKASQYYLWAVENETKQEQVAQIYFDLAALEFSGLNQYAKAREHAFKAAELKKNWEQPYILIASMYASSSGICNGNDLEKSSIFWAAVDKLQYAKSINPSKNDEINELIKLYSQHFPSKEELFFYGYKEGDPYTIKCWINENTKVRSR